MANFSFQIQQSYQFNTLCNIHSLPKDRMKSNWDNQLFFYCSECEKSIDQPTLSVQQIRDFQNYLKTFVKGSFEESINCNRIYQEITIINDMKRLSQMLQVIQSDIFRYAELANQLSKQQNYNDQTLTFIYQQFKSKQIKEEEIQKGNILFKGVVERMKIVKSSLRILQFASEQLQKEFSSVVIKDMIEQQVKQAPQTQNFTNIPPIQSQNFVANQQQFQPYTFQQVNQNQAPQKVIPFMPQNNLESVNSQNQQLNNYNNLQQAYNTFQNKIQFTIVKTQQEKNDQSQNQELKFQFTPTQNNNQNVQARPFQPQFQPLDKNNNNPQIQANKNFQLQKKETKIQQLSDTNFKKLIIQDFKQDQITIYSVSFNESETLLIMGTDACTIDHKNYYIQVWEINPEYLVNQNYLGGHDRTVKVVKFMEEKKFISGGVDARILIWKEEGREKWVIEQTLSGHSICVNGIEYVKFKFIVSCSQEMILWKEDYCLNNQYCEINRVDSFKQIISSFAFAEGDSSYLFVSYSNFIELYQIVLDSFVKIKTMQAEDKILNVITLENFDFLSLQKNSFVFWKQKDLTYVKTKFEDEGSIKQMSSYINDCDKLRLTSICYDKVCQIFQIKNNNDSGYNREKIIDLDGRFCFFSQKSRKCCLITQNQIIIYTFLKTSQ